MKQGVIQLSKYTTEVRYICETKAGLKESAGADSVDTILDNSWNKIFTSNVDFFDAAYKPILCKKILKHYYLREISAETVGIWLLWLNTKLEEIMPYYNQLYRSALLELDPFKDVDYTRTHEGEADGERNADTTINNQGTKTSQNVIDATDVSEVHGRGTSSTNTTDTGTVSDSRHITSESEAHSEGNKGDRYSDTPQGTISNTDVVGNAYLTNVRLIDDETDGTSSDETTDVNTQTRNLAGSDSNTSTDDSTTTNTKDETDSYSSTDRFNGSTGVDETTHNSDSYIERVFGKMSTMPYSDLLQKFRETFLNIDMLVIDEFDELFLRLW